MWRNRHFKENSLFIVITEGIGVCIKNKGILYRSWLQTLAEYNKLLVIQYANIGILMDLGEISKIIYHFIKYFENKVMTGVCSPTMHQFSKPWLETMTIFYHIGVITVTLHDYSRSSRIWDHVALYSIWNPSLISPCLQEGTQKLKQKCVVLSLKQEIKVLT
jgi:uncharacterized integral membrane protein